MKRKASARMAGHRAKKAPVPFRRKAVSSTTRLTRSSRVSATARAPIPRKLHRAAGHAGCFTMALSFMLNGAGFTADALDTEATLTLDQVNGNWTVTGIHLMTRARVPGIEAAKFAELASNAKANCPISRLLNASITLDAALAG